MRMPLQCAWSSLLKNIRIGKRAIVILFSFILPIATLYFLDPPSFQKVWKGRVPLLLFLWLLFLEIALGWEKLSKESSNALRRFKEKFSRIKSYIPSWLKISVIAIVVAAPTAYVIATFLFGLNEIIVEIGKRLGLVDNWFLEVSWPLSVEYLLFATFFTALSFLLYGTKGLKQFSISTFFLWATGFFYTVDTFYPEGSLVVLNRLASLIVYVAAPMLRWMGYVVTYIPQSNAIIVDGGYYGGIPHIFVARIYWPCAGINSLIIYTVVILLFLKNVAISLKWKVTCFVVGAVGTFFVNILRIVTILKIGADIGTRTADMFHSYYGEMFFIVWIIAYPIIIIGSHKMWTKLFK